MAKRTAYGKLHIWMNGELVGLWGGIKKVFDGNATSFANYFINSWRCLRTNSPDYGHQH